MGNMSDRVNQVRQKLGIVLPGEGEQVTVSEVCKYDTVAVAQAGVTTPIDFFTANYSPQTTNLRNPGKLVENGLFMAEGMAFTVRPVGDNQIDDDLTAGDVAQALINYLDNGYITVLVNDKLVLEDIALGRWPAGFGAHVSMAAATTTASINWAGATVNNGFPSIANRRNFKTPIVLQNDDIFNLSVRYGTAIAMPGTATVAIRAYVWGTRITDGER